MHKYAHTYKNIASAKQFRSFCGGIKWAQLRTAHGSKTREFTKSVRLLWPWCRKHKRPVELKHSVHSFCAHKKCSRNTWPTKAYSNRKGIECNINEQQRHDELYIDSERARLNGKCCRLLMPLMSSPETLYRQVRSLHLLKLLDLALEIAVEEARRMLGISFYTDTSFGATLNDLNPNWWYILESGWMADGLQCCGNIQKRI